MTTINQGTEKTSVFSKKISKGITKQIISCAIDVHSSLGPGLLENVYEEAFAHEFSLRGIEYEQKSWFID